MDEDAGPRCVFEECDDGMFCNGQERCEGDACVPGAPPCLEPLVCNEAAVRCETPAGCDAPDADGDGVARPSCGGDDCDDTDPDRFPGNAELCDAVDQDCDPATLGDRDDDEDGAISSECCNADRCGADCDDSSAAIGPTGTEVCDGRDDDCDGDVDEGVLRSFWPDTDRDGYGDRSMAPEFACLPEEGFVENALDCDDRRIEVNPAAAERCNGEDDNCNGVIDDASLAALSCTSAFGSPPNTRFRCEAAVCVGDCRDEERFRDCNMDLTDGCETHIAEDPLNCGSCGRTCGTHAACVDGMCDTLVELAAGERHACGRYASGAVVCWGDNEFGQLGNLSALPSRSPVPAVTSRALELDAGAFFTCARVSPSRTTDTGIVCWGRNRDGEMGTGSLSEREPFPTAVQTSLGGELALEEVFLGGRNGCARGSADSGSMLHGGVCWGAHAGQLGRGAELEGCDPTGMGCDAMPFRPDPSAGATPMPFEVMAVGEHHLCALLESRARCSGRGAAGQLGDGLLTDSDTLVVVDGGPFTLLAAGLDFTCGQTPDHIQCWGAGGSGQSGNEGLEDSALPTEIAGTDNTTVALCAGRAHACALDESSVRCWGDNRRGQLGVPGPDSSASAEVVELSGVVDLVCGADFTCALRDDGTVACWGDNRFGQLGGASDAVMEGSPVDLPGL